jgi:Protein of unknown function (DUF2938)
MSIDSLCIAILVGVGATLIMDIWAVFLQRAFNISSLSFCLVGRWLGHMMRGKFSHEKITTATKIPAECILGWSAHYLIGVAFTLILVICTSSDWLEKPTPAPALLIGLITLAIPFLIMQPALGLGIAAAKTSNPIQARLKSTATHLVFGIGLYVSACVIGYIQSSNF